MRYYYSNELMAMNETFKSVHLRNKNKDSLQLEKRRNISTEAPITKPEVTFQESLGITLLIGQLFSLIPISGISGNDISRISFRATSWRSMYSLFSILGQSLITMMCVIEVFHSDTTLKDTAPVVIYASTCISMALFFRIGVSWPRLVRKIYSLEEIDPNYDTGLRNRCNYTCAIILLVSLVEHILSLLSAFAGSIACYPTKSLYEGFVLHFYPWVFDFIPYSPVLGFITQYLHIQSTFIWNFTDLFVICMSYYLISRLQLINKKLAAIGKKHMSDIFWKSIREDYARTTLLVRKVDDVINAVILLSFANNLFFICLQLFNSIENGVNGRYHCEGVKHSDGPLQGFESSTYLQFSLVYLISRSVAVSLITSQVHSASRAPGPFLYEVSSEEYCVEVQRFIEQLHLEKVALSGLNFFTITKGLLLTVAGTIVTYELVLVQFDTPAATPAPPINEVP